MMTSLMPRRGEELVWGGLVGKAIALFPSIATAKVVCSFFFCKKSVQSVHFFCFALMPTHACAHFRKFGTGKSCELTLFVCITLVFTTLDCARIDLLLALFLHISSILYSFFKKKNGCASAIQTCLRTFGLHVFGVKKALGSV